MKGSDVKDVQAALNKQMAAGIDIDGEYGPQTAGAVKEWRYASGFKVVNYTLPPRAQEILFGTRKLTIAEKTRAKLRAKRRNTANPWAKAVAIAEREIGIKEHPANSNSGPRVRQYQATTGAYYAPWCASFVTWVFAQAGRKLSGFNTAYCPSSVSSAREAKNGLRVIPAREVRPGDLAMYDWQGDGVSDHIGICASIVQSSGDFTCIEGNTAVGNDSNGGQVMRRARNSRQVICFIRISK